MSIIRAAATILILISSLHAFAFAQTASDKPCPKIEQREKEDIREPDHLVLHVDFDCFHPPFWFRVGDQMWQKGPDSGVLSIEYTSVDHFILVASGDCNSVETSKCFPLALLVQTAVSEIDENDSNKKRS